MTYVRWLFYPNQMTFVNLVCPHIQPISPTSKSPRPISVTRVFYTYPRYVYNPPSPPSLTAHKFHIYNAATERRVLTRLLLPLPHPHGAVFAHPYPIGTPFARAMSSLTWGGSLVGSTNPEQKLGYGGAKRGR